MPKRTIVEQYEYETKERGLSHTDALDQMKWMYTATELNRLELELSQMRLSDSKSSINMCDYCGEPLGEGEAEIHCGKPWCGNCDR